MKRRSSVLREALGSRYREYILRDARQQSIFDRLDAIRESCGGQSLGLNLTGGTKLMALAAAEWAYACEVPAFYIDTETDQIVLPTRRGWEYVALPDLLDVKGLLAANGYMVESLEAGAVLDEQRKALVGMLELVCQGSQSAEMALRGLNACAQEAGRHADRVAKENVRPSPAWEKLLAFCEQAGMAHRGQGWLSFPSEEARAWCNGIWFEKYVQMILYRLKAEGRITSWASSVQVRNKAVPNEFDALFSVRNRLFMLECKTSVMSEPLRPDAMLYKLDALHRRAGGVFARAMLCSIFPLDPHARNRAEEHRIRVVSGRDLLNLGDLLVRWIAARDQ